MSGQQLLDMLRRLGYPGVDQLDTSSLEWMFDNEATLPFLHWLCTTVGEDNLLQPAQIQQYELLASSSDSVLDGPQLEQALQSLSVKDSSNITDEVLQIEISRLEEEREHCRAKKQHLLQQKNRLSVHFLGQTHRYSQLPDLEKKAKKKYKQQVEQSQADNVKVDQTLKDLSKTLDAVCCLYKTPDGSRAPYFLSQVKLDVYQQAEHSFTEQLTEFTKKQFFEGIADMAGRNDSTHYELLEVSNPQSLFVRGEKENVNVADCQELERLESVYPTSECERLNGLISEKSTLAACRAVEQRLESCREQPFSSDVQKLSEQINTAQSKLIQLQESTSLLTNQIASLIKDSSGLQVSKILSGDYNLKIIRQDYFISKQDQVINELVLQRARYELLKILYELEAQRHRQMRHLVATAAQHLSDTDEKKEQRLKMMGDSMLSDDRHQRGTINSRDTSMMSLYHILNGLDSEDQQQLFVSNDSLVRSAENLRHKLTASQSSVTSNSRSQAESLSQLEENLSSCKAVVYAGSSTTVGVPQLSAQVVRDAISQLTTMLNGLEQSLIDIIKDIGHKKEMLNNDPLMKKERDIYLHFFNQPEKLNVLTDQLSAGIDSLSLK